MSTDTWWNECEEGKTKEIRRQHAPVPLHEAHKKSWTQCLITSISYIYPIFSQKSVHYTSDCGVDKWHEANAISTLVSALTLSPDLSMPLSYHQYAPSLKPTPNDSFSFIVHFSFVRSFIHYVFSFTTPTFSYSNLIERKLLWGLNVT
jgi:hypothetical protein